MKIDEATENSKDLVKSLRYNKSTQFSLSSRNSYAESVQLGIEALERLKRLRQTLPAQDLYRKLCAILPSETKE